MHCPVLGNLPHRPHRTTALDSYRCLVSGYDRNCRWIERIRAEALVLLALRDGDTVLDVACGTGVMLPALSRAVGDRGRVIGIEQSPEMAAIAASRIEEARLANVRLIVAPVEEAPIGELANAALFCFSHDVLQSDRAIENVVRHARPDARVVAAGTRLLGWWAAPLNVWKLWRSRHYLSTYAGLRDPTKRLRQFCPDLRVLLTHTLGTSYLAVGHCAERAEPPGAIVDLKISMHRDTSWATPS
jgi:SAM-dependent methyltransferase